MPLQSINPATGEVLKSLPAHDEAAVQARLTQASEAAAEQRALPLEHRVLCLRKLAALLDEEAADVAHAISVETGKSITLALAEVRRCADCCRYYAENASRLLAPELIQADGGQAYIQWSPIGVVLAVMPWESPLWHALRFLAPTLVAGNTVVLKHAASVPQTALMIEGLVRRAGFVRGTVTALLVDDRMVEGIFADERIAAVTVTGSEVAGRALAAQAGWLLKRYAIHLPGNDVFVVMATADIPSAVDAAIRAFKDGVGARRIVLETSIYGDFVRRFIPAVEGLRVGDPLRDDTEIGPLGTAESAASLDEAIKAAVSAGGRILSGGARLVGRGNFIEPTVLSDVPRTAPVARDFIAGPVAFLFRARDVNDAVAAANSSPSARTASVWTKEPTEQQALIAGVDAGTVSLNALPPWDARLPVGGARRAGSGRELGAQGIREFLVAKTVSLSQ